MLREMSKTIPLGRFGTEAEAAAGVVFLLSPAASFISGSTLRIDGARPQVRMGWPMQIASEKARQREAIKPFEGFHRATTPKVFL
jgi:citronellol/citronellal dehydrogenase